MKRLAGAADYAAGSSSSPPLESTMETVDFAKAWAWLLADPDRNKIRRVIWRETVWLEIQGVSPSSDADVPYVMAYQHRVRPQVGSFRQPWAPQNVDLFAEDWVLG